MAVAEPVADLHLVVEPKEPEKIDCVLENMRISHAPSAVSPPPPHPSTSPP